MTIAQEYLNQNYLKIKRSQIKSLNISSLNLEGTLDLSDFLNLEQLNCSQNKLTNLKFSEISKLKIINCSYNKLTNLDFLAQLDKEVLKRIDLSNNEFSQTDLTAFSPFVELELLIIANNSFQGSLESLKNLSELKHLDISNTDINEGLEYLPNNKLEKFFCATNSSWWKQKSHLVSKIQEKLSKYGRESQKFGFTNNLKLWKEDNPDKLIHLEEPKENFKAELKERLKQQKDLSNYLEDFLASREEIRNNKDNTFTQRQLLKSKKRLIESGKITDSELDRLERQQVLEMERQALFIDNRKIIK